MVVVLHSHGDGHNMGALILFISIRSSTGLNLVMNMKKPENRDVAIVEVRKGTAIWSYASVHEAIHEHSAQFNHHAVMD